MSLSASAQRVKNRKKSNAKEPSAPLHRLSCSILARVRVVGSASAGFSGQKCLGERPFISLRTSGQFPRQNPGRSVVT